jgi:hypothetical protein
MRSKVLSSTVSEVGVVATNAKSSDRVRAVQESCAQRANAESTAAEDEMAGDPLRVDDASCRAKKGSIANPSSDAFVF